MRKMFFHFIQVKCKKVFSGDGLDPRKMIYFLEQMHSNKHIGINGKVSPQYIPVSALMVSLNLPIEMIGDL